jgi:hypothetical protein
VLIRVIPGVILSLCIDGADEARDYYSCTEAAVFGISAAFTTELWLL